MNIEFIISNVPRNTILEMLKKEQEIKYSKEIQDIYTLKFYNKSTVNIDIEIQKFVLKQFNFTDSKKSLHNYWKIPSTYWNDNEIKNSVFYMKYNIFQYTSLMIDDSIVNCNLIEYPTKKSVSLFDISNQTKPLVLLAGSIT
uniref:Uncharacterized protein n=1 Tax=viral metagenome TaxID=1070528 RepID=A0A6C0H5H2_9ZZZZ